MKFNLTAFYALATIVVLVTAATTDVDLTAADIKNIQDTWAVTKTLGYFTVGDKIFVDIFAALPEAKNSFNFARDPNYRNSA